MQTGGLASSLAAEMRFPESCMWQGAAQGWTAFGLFCEHKLDERVSYPPFTAQLTAHAAQAVRARHLAASETEGELARQRLAFEEFLVLMLGLLLQRANLQCASGSLSACYPFLLCSAEQDSPT